MDLTFNLSVCVSEKSWLSVNDDIASNHDSVNIDIRNIIFQNILGKY